ncbi:hypothetical protein TSUD_211800 [Trifolium subterraneum]|uniref:Uncharacterized protein n=1 Tax=Trifolium subterraneum TaxID=3900 RepID=A0A2Z6MKG0_TRISU|nr:hypothetical protein TSUD_211800 [Trifolium subterraneum]
MPTSLIFVDGLRMRGMMSHSLCGHFIAMRLPEWVLHQFGYMWPLSPGDPPRPCEHEVIIEEQAHRGRSPSYKPDQ